MRYIVCYDVSDDKRRRKISEVLDGYGDRIQESVFELPVESLLMDKCMGELMDLVKESEDCVAIYRLCASCDSERTYFGEAASDIGEETAFVV